MKKSELLEYFKEYLNDEVRKIIREEISTNIRKIIREELEMSKGIVTEIKRPIIKKKVQKKVIQKKVIQKPKNVERQIFSRDAVLNDILNETASNMTPRNPITETAIHNKMGMDDEWEAMDLKTSMNMSPTLQPQMSTQAAVSAEEMVPADKKHVVDALPEFLQKALTRDYTELMKMEPKRGNNPLNGMR